MPSASVFLARAVLYRLPVTVVCAIVFRVHTPRPTTYPGRGLSANRRVDLIPLRQMTFSWKTLCQIASVGHKTTHPDGFEDGFKDGRESSTDDFQIPHSPLDRWIFSSLDLDHGSAVWWDDQVQTEYNRSISISIVNHFPQAAPEAVDTFVRYCSVRQRPSGLWTHQCGLPASLERLQAAHSLVEPTDHGPQGIMIERSHFAGVNGPIWKHTVPAFPNGCAAEKEHNQVAFHRWIVDKSNFRRLLLACAMQAATQMTGVSAIHLSINSIIGLIGEFLLMMVVDKIGRRKLVVGGNLPMCLTYVISTILLAQFPPEVNSSGAHWGFIIMTWVFNFCFASMGSLSWMIPAEIFDTATRARGVALGCMVCNFTNAVFFWAMLPETKQLPLEEMKKLFTETPWFIGNSIKSEHRVTETSILAQRIKTIGLEDLTGTTEHKEETA
ncbi:hypothetical protein Aspvir_006982 [Aspergillus viridinutans]|uniref:Major facilitator superfamily (MFS) profile domain-containing protein n=1 Tax=Aspergillus viridinutans TaxID=75553 RepID=A0A9P3BVT5_ASPVI|nr:uncharacterized protein Aspvir_006982 [Aspergillus viridinutans]GIK02917.1 hypothetical protein Aspvir_006982 [Aspergillus viridinutans]